MSERLRRWYAIDVHVTLLLQEWCAIREILDTLTARMSLLDRASGLTRLTHITMVRAAGRVAAAGIVKRIRGMNGCQGASGCHEPHVEFTEG